MIQSAKGHLKNYLGRKMAAAPLSVFRIMLGLLLFVSLLRFWCKGWIDELYIQPRYFFPFYGFEWVRPLGTYTYLIFVMGMISALLVMVGYFYRLAMLTLFLSFTYIELMDKSTYLNHYYFVSLVCLLMVFLPAHVYFSVDARKRRTIPAAFIPQWCLDVLKLLVFILYFYAGLAKLNSDWLLAALPLKIWLPARNDFPLIGRLFNDDVTAYIFSWFGCIYDLLIVFFLLKDKTRPYAYATVVIFHLLTSVLFPIGMFPLIMIGTGLIFFSAEFHQKILQGITSLFRFSPDIVSVTRDYQFSKSTEKLILGALTVFFIFQLIFPFRYLAYPDELFWSEQGYRFSWRVMPMEKAGYAQFTVKDAQGRSEIVNNTEFLTTLQEKMMSTQPDMMLQYAHILKRYYEEHGFETPSVYVDSYVSLNGRLGKPLVDPDTDLTKETDSFQNKNWITPLNDEIKGF